MARGMHRVYLGAAPGVGKTYAMLNEGTRRQARGDDVAIGWVEYHDRAETRAKAEGLERVAPRRLSYRGREFEEMDVDAVIARRPEVALVDELAHTNIPGSRNTKRWQDVEALLEAGINVISTVNVQHLESLNDVIEQITGVRQRETIPDHVVRRADQVELVDLTPEALRRRLARGDVYPGEKIDAAMTNYFRAGNLGALRELALLWVADQVEESLDAYMEAHGIEEPWETRERVIVALSGEPGDDALVRRAARIARVTRGGLLGVHIRPADGLAGGADPRELERLRSLLEALGGSYREVIGADVAGTLLGLARTERATQLVLGASSRSRLAEFLRGSVINAVNRGSGPIDIHVISEVRGEPRPELEGARPRWRPPVEVAAHRRRLAWIVAAITLPLLTASLVAVRDHIGLTSVALLYLLLVVIVALLGGSSAAITTAVATFLALNFFYTEPFYTFNVSESEVVIELIAYVIVAAIVSYLVGLVNRRSAEAARARAEAEAIAHAASGQETLADLVEAVRAGFNLQAVALLEPSAGGWTPVESAGEDPPSDPAGGERLDCGHGDAVLVVRGRPLSGDDYRVLKVVADQLGAAVERQRLAREAAESAELAETDRLRTALLRAVSHDLRTPLSSIKAAVTSLLQGDVDWTRRDTHDLLATVNEETDRLNRLVGNLLDLSRLEAGAVRPVIRPVGLDEVVPAALSSSGDIADCVAVDIDEGLPRVLVDPGLFERAVANVVLNAVSASPPDQPPRVTAGVISGRVDLRVVDHGPGIPASERERVFAPFQRLDDTGKGGTGLGLAVARGFVEAMDGQLTLEDTPGGGTTVAISLLAQQTASTPPDAPRELV